MYLNLLLIVLFILSHLLFQSEDDVFSFLEFILQLLPGVSVVVALVGVDLLEFEDFDLEHVSFLFKRLYFD